MRWRSVLIGTLGTAAVCAAALVAGVPPAAAGTYEQFVCKRPDGSSAPADGWRSSVAGGGWASVCGSPYDGFFGALPGGVVPAGASASLSWSEPGGGVFLAGMRLRRRVVLAPHAGPGTRVYRLNSPTSIYRSPDIREWCHFHVGCAGIPDSELVLDNLAGGGVWLILECRDGPCDDGAGDYNWSSSAGIISATMVLSDTRAPEIQDVGGRFASGSPLWGVATLTYRATDAGSGVYRHRLELDGTALVDEVVDSAGGKCRDALPQSQSAYQFDYVVPCPRAVAGEIAVDLGAVLSGRHKVVATVEDAAGNRRQIFSGEIVVLSDPGRRTVALPGVIGLTNPLGDRPGWVPNGANAGRTAFLDAFVKRPRGGGRRGPVRASVSTYPRMPRLGGRLTHAGEPIAYATVAILERPLGAETWRQTRTTQTTSKGGLTDLAVAGPSRDIRFAYFADSEATIPTLSPAVRVSVRPRVRLRARPALTRNGQRVKFRGRVSGYPPSSRGLVVSLQAGTRGSRWITFRVVSSAPDGTFRASYRFRQTRRTIRYRFRAVVPRQANHPLAPGRSAPAWVLVRG